jgi:hypothetical protein
LRGILRGLLMALAAWRLEPPALGCVMYGRIGRTFARIEQLFVRFRAGRLWRRVVKPRARNARRDVDSAGRGPALPRKFGWLVMLGGSEAACYGSQLQHVLSTPEMAELLAASPQAQRILRPLCRALAISLPGTDDKPCADRPCKLRKPRPKPEPFKIPLPRGVLTWARREWAIERALKAAG